MYDKYNERKNRLKCSKKSSHYEVEISPFINVYRTELRLGSRRLYYNKKNLLHLDKTLDNYLNESVADKCFNRFVEPIFYTEPFYRIDFAVDTIKNNKSLKSKEKEKLCTLVKDINSKGFTNAKLTYCYCDDTFEKHIKLLRSIGINPLTFDQNINITIMPNFTLKPTNK